MAKQSTSEQVSKEAMFGTLPMRKNERQYGLLDAFLVLSGYGIATWCYSQGALQAQYTNFAGLLTSTLAANIFIVAIYMLPMVFATRYGVDMWQWNKAISGTKGSGIVAVVLVAVNFPWFALCADIFSSTIMNLFSIFGVNLPDVLAKPIGLSCIVIGTIIAIAGPVVIKWANRVIVPAQLLVGVIIVIIGFTAVPFEQILNYTPDVSAVVDEGTSAYAVAIECGFAFGISWCASTAVTPRICKKERDGYWSTVGAYGLVAPFFVLAGGILGIACLIKTGVMGEDVAVMLNALSGPRMALISLLLVVFANLATQGTGSYMWSVVLKTTFPKLSFKTLCIGLGIYASIFTIWGGLLDHLGTMITVAAYAYGPVMGVLFADYFFIRKRRVSLRAIYELEGHDCYKYTKGYNIVAIAVVVIGFLADLAIFDPIAYQGRSVIFNMTTVTFFGCLVGAILYIIVCQIPAVKNYMLQDRNDITV